MAVGTGVRAAGDGADGRHTRQGQERKAQLLEHAAALFAERGYAETRIIDIVRAAGVAKGLFYWYFENKEALFRELVDDVRLRLRQNQESAIDPEADPLTRIRQGVEASIRFMAEQRRLYSVFDIESAGGRFGDVLRKGSRVHASDTARHVVEGIQRGLIRDEDPQLLATGVLATVSSFSSLHRAGRLAVDVDDLAAFTGRFVVRALAVDDATASAALS